VGRILKNEIKPHLEKLWYIRGIDSRFIWQIEKILGVYEKPYNADYPVTYFDKRPCQLIEDVVQPLGMKKGYKKREDYSTIIGMEQQWPWVR
jgi:hypothetical protein